MLHTDVSVLKEVRRELARTPVKFELIQFGVTRGVIYFGGEFRVQTPVRKLNKQKNFEVLVGTLIALEKRLRRIQGVKDIYFRFNNIHKSGGFWRRALGRE